MYIIGYGSLINAESRQLTGQTGDAVPVTLTGYQRYWSDIDSRYSLSPLVVTPGDGELNGVLIPVDSAALVEFDRREIGYQRHEVSQGCLRGFVDGSDLTAQLQETQVWIYTRDSIEAPSDARPVAQTYIDTVLAGCLAISEQFAVEFLASTLGWECPVLNDRVTPKYGNAAHVPDRRRMHIDALLNQRGISSAC